MKIAAFALLCFLLLAPSRAQWNYPTTKTVDATDTYFGKTYADPYRWLENSQDKSVEQWFKDQAALTDGLLAKIPARDALAAEWLALDKLKPATYSGITFENHRMFYKKTRGGENIGKLYFREGWSGDELLLFDPANYKPGVTTVIQSFLPSWDGKYVVLGLTAAGAEWSELRVLHVTRRELLAESLYPCWGASSWTADSKAFLYDRGNTTDIKSLDIELNRQTRVHKLGHSVENDADIFSNQSHPELKIEPKEIPIAMLDESYPHYVFGVAATVQNEVRMYYAPIAELTSDRINWKELSRVSDNLVRGMAFHGDYMYAITHTGAPKYKVVRTKIKNPDWAHAEIVAPEASDSVVGLTKSKNYLLISYSDGISTRILKYNFATGKKSKVKLPSSGTVDVSVPDSRTDLCHVVITSWIQPSTRYDYDAKHDTFKKSEFNSDVTYPGFENLVTEEVEVRGHDGAMIP